VICTLLSDEGHGGQAGEALCLPKGQHSRRIPIVHLSIQHTAIESMMTRLVVIMSKGDIFLAKLKYRVPMLISDPI